MAESNPQAFDFSRLNAMAETDAPPAESPLATVAGAAPPEQPGEPLGTEDSPMFQARPNPEDVPAIPQDHEAYVRARAAEEESRKAAAASDQTEDEDDGPSTEDQSPEAVLDVLEPRVAPREWLIGPEGDKRQYVQRKLPLVRKMEFFALVADVMTKAMQGDEGLSVNDLVNSPTTPGQRIDISSFGDADTFVMAIGKLVAHSPDFFTDCICLWLNVPGMQRETVKYYLALDEEDGGLSDEDGMIMIETFIDQNYEAIADFFDGKIARLQRRVTAVTEARKNRKRR